MVLAGQTLSILRSTESRFGQKLALDELLKAFQALEEPGALVAALALSAALARELGDPSAGRRAELLHQLVPEFKPDAQFDGERAAEWVQLLDQAIVAQGDALRKAGEDPYVLWEEEGAPECA